MLLVQLLFSNRLLLHIQPIKHVCRIQTCLHMIMYVLFMFCWPHNTPCLHIHGFAYITLCIVTCMYIKVLKLRKKFHMQTTHIYIYIIYIYVCVCLWRLWHTLRQLAHNRSVTIMSPNPSAWRQKKQNYEVKKS